MPAQKGREFNSPGIWRLSRPAERVVEMFFLFAFCLAGLAYFFAFSQDLDHYLFHDYFFDLALNSHDHLYYLDTLDSLKADGIEYQLNNDFGIASIYWLLSKLFPFLINDQLTLLSFVFNTGTLIVNYVLWMKICDFYGFSLKIRLSFFLNTSLLYFMQLINKDMLTSFGFLFAIYAGINRRLVLLVLALPFLFFVRQQLAIFAMLYIYFMGEKDERQRILFAYVVTSIVAGVLSAFAGFLGEETAGEGLSSFLIQLNTDHYYIGYLIFNPLRVVQYVVDVYLSFSVFTEKGTVDVAKLLRWPQLILLLMLWRPSLAVITRFKYWLSTRARPLVLTMVSYLLAWLMNPTVNARYVMLITPVLLLFAFYVRSANTELVIDGHGEQTK